MDKTTVNSVNRASESDDSGSDDGGQESDGDCSVSLCSVNSSENKSQSRSKLLNRVEKFSARKEFRDDGQISHVLHDESRNAGIWSALQNGGLEGFEDSNHPQKRKRTYLKFRLSEEQHAYALKTAASWDKSRKQLIVHLSQHFGCKYRVMQMFWQKYLLSKNRVQTDADGNLQPPVDQPLQLEGTNGKTNRSKNKKFNPTPEEVAWIVETERNWKGRRFELWQYIGNHFGYSEFTIVAWTKREKLTRTKTGAGAGAGVGTNGATSEELQKGKEGAKGSRSDEDLPSATFPHGDSATHSSPFPSVAAASASSPNAGPQSSSSSGSVPQLPRQLQGVPTKTDSSSASRFSWAEMLQVVQSLPGIVHASPSAPPSPYSFTAEHDVSIWQEVLRGKDISLRQLSLNWAALDAQQQRPTGACEYRWSYTLGPAVRAYKPSVLRSGGSKLFLPGPSPLLPAAAAKVSTNTASAANARLLTLIDFIRLADIPGRNQPGAFTVREDAIILWDVMKCNKASNPVVWPQLDKSMCRPVGSCYLRWEQVLEPAFSAYAQRLSATMPPPVAVSLTSTTSAPSAQSSAPPPAFTQARTSQSHQVTPMVMASSSAPSFTASSFVSAVATNGLAGPAGPVASAPAHPAASAAPHTVSPQFDTAAVLNAATSFAPEEDIALASRVTSYDYDVSRVPWALLDAALCKPAGSCLCRWQNFISPPKKLQMSRPQQKQHHQQLQLQLQQLQQQQLQQKQQQLQQQPPPRQQQLLQQQHRQQQQQQQHSTHPALQGELYQPSEVEVTNHAKDPSFPFSTLWNVIGNTSSAKGAIAQQHPHYYHQQQLQQWPRQGQIFAPSDAYLQQHQGPPPSQQLSQQPPQLSLPLPLPLSTAPVQQRAVSVVDLTCESSDSDHAISNANSAAANPSGGVQNATESSEEEDDTSGSDGGSGSDTNSDPPRFLPASRAPLSAGSIQHQNGDNARTAVAYSRSAPQLSAQLPQHLQQQATSYSRPHNFLSASANAGNSHIYSTPIGDRILQAVQLLNLPDRARISAREDAFIWHNMLLARRAGRSDIWQQAIAALCWPPGHMEYRWFSVLEPTIRRLCDAIGGGTDAAPESSLFSVLNRPEPVYSISRSQQSMMPVRTMLPPCPQPQGSQGGRFPMTVNSATAAMQADFGIGEQYDDFPAPAANSLLAAATAASSNPKSMSTPPPSPLPSVASDSAAITYTAAAITAAGPLPLQPTLLPPSSSRQSSSSPRAEWLADSRGAWMAMYASNGLRNCSEEFYLSCEGKVAQLNCSPPGTFTLHHDTVLLVQVKLCKAEDVPVPWAQLDTLLQKAPGECLHRWEKVLLPAFQAACDSLRERKRQQNIQTIESAQTRSVIGSAHGRGREGSGAGGGIESESDTNSSAALQLQLQPQPQPKRRRTDDAPVL